MSIEAPPAAEGWKKHVQYRREFNCICGYMGWEYWNPIGPTTLICTKCGNGRKSMIADILAEGIQVSTWIRCLNCWPDGADEPDPWSGCEVCHGDIQLPLEEAGP